LNRLMALIHDLVGAVLGIVLVNSMWVHAFDVAARVGGEQRVP
jgi:hypothetical protein